MYGRTGVIGVVIGAGTAAAPGLLPTTGASAGLLVFVALVSLLAGLLLLRVGFRHRPRSGRHACS